MGHPGRGERAFDFIAGVILPVLCVLLDPIVFQRRIPGDFSHDPALLQEYQIFAYSGIALEIVLLSIWLLAGKRLEGLGGFFAGVFAVGAALSLLLGLRLLPVSLVGTLFHFIGLLGLTPFLTAFVYAINACRAFRCSRSRASPAPLLACGVILAWGLPLFACFLIPPFSLDAIFKSAGHIRVMPVIFSPDGRVIFSGNRDGSLRAWNARTGDLLKSARAHAGAINSLASSATSSLLATGGEDGTVRLWNLELVRVRELGRHRGAVHSVAFNPSGDILASGGSDALLKIWTVDSGESRVLGMHGGPVTSVAFSPGRETIASACEDGIVRLWDLRSGERRLEFTGHRHPVRALSFSPDGKAVLSGSGWITRDFAYPDGELLLWNPETGTVLRDLKPIWFPYVISVAFSPDGRQVASGGWSEVGRARFDLLGVNLKALDSDRFWDQLKGGGSPSCGATLAFSPDGKWLATGDRGDIVRLWDARSRAFLQQFTEPGRPLPFK